MKTLIILLLILTTNVKADQVTYEPIITNSGEAISQDESPKVWDSLTLIKVILDTNSKVLDEGNLEKEGYQTMVTIEASLTNSNSKQATVIRSVYLDNPRDYNENLVVPQEEVDTAVNNLIISLEQEYLK